LSYRDGYAGIHRTFPQGWKATFPALPTPAIVISEINPRANSGAIHLPTLAKPPL